MLLYLLKLVAKFQILNDSPNLTPALVAHAHRNTSAVGLKCAPWLAKVLLITAYTAETPEMKATVLFRNLHIDCHWNLAPLEERFALTSAFRHFRLLCTASLLIAVAWAPTPIHGQSSLVIDHRYANTDAQSLIGLPMGSHKTIVDKSGSLKWSQWSLKRKPLDTPIGFSSQMDGALAIEASVDSRAH